MTRPKALAEAASRVWYQILPWLHQRNAAVVAVATVVNVVVAIVYAFFTWGLWRQARHQARQTRAMFEGSRTTTPL